MSSSTDGTYVYHLYQYDPSHAAAVLAIILFTVTTAAHLFQMVKLKTWYWIPFVIGGFFQIVGYIGRSLSSKDKEALGPFIMQSLLLLIAPALYAASIYMLLGRLTRLVRGEHLSIIRINWLTKFFVLGDVISFLMQGTGGGIMAGGSLKSMDLGKKIILIGLFVQVFFFGFFLIAMTVFLRRFKASGLPSPSPQRETGMRRIAAGLTSNWRALVISMYSASVLIMVRSIFRLAEYGQGHDGYLQSHEVYLYIFDAMLMFATMVIFNLCHPGGVVSRRALEKALTGGSELMDQCTGGGSGYIRPYGQV